MLRVMRLPAAGLRPDLREGFLVLPAFLHSLPVSPDVKGLIASYQIEGDHINFFVNMQGGVAPVACDAGVPQFAPPQSLARMRFENHRAALLNAIVNQNSPAAVFLQVILQQPQFMVTIDQDIPVLIPFIGDPVGLAAPEPMASMASDTTETAGLAAGGATPAVGAGVSGAGAEAAAASASSSNSRSIGGLVLWSLLALLLLGGSIFGYFKTLYPWPFVDEPKIAEKVVAGYAEEQPNASETSESSESSESNAGLEQELANLSDQAASSTDDQQAQLAKDASAKAAEAERLAQEQAAPEAKEVVVAAESQTPQAAEPQSTLPKCDTIKDKMPMLFLALDGSGSMVAHMSEYKFKRRDAALKTTEVLLKRLDKNVDIHAYALKSCPTATDLGVFKVSDREQLRTELAAMYGTKGSGSSTPLETALQFIADAAPADVESTAIVVTDVVDTCYFKGRVPLCDLAKQIHADKPKLKIHVIFVGGKVFLKYVECLAKSTNGQIFFPKSIEQLELNIEQASNSLVKVCQ